MKTRKEIKEQAKGNFLKRYWMNVGATFLPPVFVAAAMSVIGLIMSIPFTIFFGMGMVSIAAEAKGVSYSAALEADIVSYIIGTIVCLIFFAIFSTIISAFVTAPIMCGHQFYNNEEYEGVGAEKGTNIGTPWVKGFTKQTPRRAGGFILMNLFTFLWSLLLFIPGIIKTYSYAMTMYLMAMFPDMKARDAITLSRKLMVGHKWQLFVMRLSFVGWTILTVLSFGLVGIFFVNPYESLSITGFFHEVLKEGYSLGENDKPEWEDRAEFPIFPLDMKKMAEKGREQAAKGDAEVVEPVIPQTEEAPTFDGDAQQ